MEYMIIWARQPSEPFDDTWTWRRRFHLTRVEDVSVTQKALQIKDVQYVFISSSKRVEHRKKTLHEHVFITF